MDGGDLPVKSSGFRGDPYRNEPGKAANKKISTLVAGERRFLCLGVGN